MFSRAKYKDNEDLPWHTLPDPVATLKRDGGHDFLQIEADGTQRYFSRRPSIKGGFPEHTDKIPHISSIKLPQFAGNVYSVEMIHTGHSKDSPESHPKSSGILTSLAPRAIQTQKDTGPLRAVLLDVINPVLPTYRDKLEHLKNLEKAVGKPEVFFLDNPETTKEGIVKLINRTKAEGREGVIVTSLTLPESRNPRIKIKHKSTWNLRVSAVIQEQDIRGNSKPSMGALELTDSSGRVVGRVGTGFDQETRSNIWKHRQDWVGKLVQVVGRKLVKADGRLIQPVYNGLADGDIDLVT